MRSKRIIDCTAVEILDIGKQLIDYYFEKKHHDERVESVNVYKNISRDDNNFNKKDYTYNPKWMQEVQCQDQKGL